MMGTIPCDPPIGNEDFWWGNCPNYLHDLNAMHEAEMMCLRSISTMESYRAVLKEILARTHAIELDFCACAANRAEALLKTIGKWVEY